MPCRSFDDLVQLNLDYVESLEVLGLELPHVVSVDGDSVELKVHKLVGGADQEVMDMPEILAMQSFTEQLVQLPCACDVERVIPVEDRPWDISIVSATRHVLSNLFIVLRSS
jgi:hypothetical protein